MDVNVTIIGAGVVGLAVANELARHYEDLFVIDERSTFGQGISSRNSEVIHAGIYYKPGSLKAKLCVEGKHSLYHLCEEHGIGYRRVGKIIVATASDEMSYLESLLLRGKTNGVDDLELITEREVTALEPNVTSLGGLFSPSTGIIDSYGLMSFLYGSSAGNGVDFVFNTEIVDLKWDPEGIGVVTRASDGSIFRYRSRVVVNCAGLKSDRVASLIGIDIEKKKYRLYYCKGDYFTLRPSLRNRVSHLIYPVNMPDSAGLGIHITMDLNGRLRLGPDAVYIDRKHENYRVDSAKREGFANLARRYLTAIKADDLTPDLAGIRPKRSPPGTPQRDFIIHHEPDLYGFINLVGIESPGLTSSLAIGRFVHGLIQQDRILN